MKYTTEYLLYLVVKHVFTVRHGDGDACLGQMEVGPRVLRLQGARLGREQKLLQAPSLCTSMGHACANLGAQGPSCGRVLCAVSVPWVCAVSVPWLCAVSILWPCAKCSVCPVGMCYVCPVAVCRVPCAASVPWPCAVCTGCCLAYGLCLLIEWPLMKWVQKKCKINMEKTFFENKYSFPRNSVHLPLLT